jgi:hypothetical protein
MRRLLSATFILLVLFVKGQEKKDSTALCKGDISLNGGLGLPVGKFGQVSRGTYAIKGPAFNIAASLPVKNSIYEIGLMLGYNSNTFDLQAYLNDKVEHFDSYNAQGSGEFTAICAMTGIILNLPKNWKRTCFYFRFLVGFGESFSPYMSYKYINWAATPIVEESHYINAVHGLGLAADLGIGVKSNLYKKIGCMVSVDYLYTESNVTATDQVTNVVGNVSYVPNNTGFAISLVNVCAGISYRLGK